VGKVRVIFSGFMAGFEKRDSSFLLQGRLGGERQEGRRRAERHFPSEAFTVSYHFLSPNTTQWVCKK
jgi:hypothetical protein